MTHYTLLQTDADGRPAMASGHLFDEHAAEVRWCKSFNDEVTEEIPVGDSLFAKIGPDCFDYLSMHLPPECRPINDATDVTELTTTQPLRAIQ